MTSTDNEKYFSWNQNDFFSEKQEETVAEDAIVNKEQRGVKFSLIRANFLTPFYMRWPRVLRHIL